eukprot:2766717-Rhodomonas_salina.1
MAKCAPVCAGSGRSPSPPPSAFAPLVFWRTNRKTAPPTTRTPHTIPVTINARCRRNVDFFFVSSSSGSLTTPGGGVVVVTATVVVPAPPPTAVV